VLENVNFAILVFDKYLLCSIMTFVRTFTGIFSVRI